MKLQVLKKYPSIRHFNFPCTYIVSGSYSYCFSHEVFSEPHRRKFITLGKLIEMKWDVGLQHYTTSERVFPTFVDVLT